MHRVALYATAPKLRHARPTFGVESGSLHTQRVASHPDLPKNAKDWTVGLWLSNGSFSVWFWSIESPSQQMSRATCASIIDQLFYGGVTVIINRES